MNTHQPARKLPVSFDNYLVEFRALVNSARPPKLMKRMAAREHKPSPVSGMLDALKKAKLV